MLRLCKKKKKVTRRVKEELKETTSEYSDTEEEKEVNRVVRDKLQGQAEERQALHGGAQ